MPGLDIPYAETKVRLLEAIGGFESDSWSTIVPATPEWTVLDLVAHVAGNAADGAAATLPDINLMEQFRDPSVVAARDDFADGQVLRRQGHSPAEVVAEWDEAEPELLKRLAVGGADSGLPLGFDVILVTDLCVHADDVAHALGLPPNRESAAGRIALAGYCFGVDYRIKALGLPALTLRYGSREKKLGEGEAGATLSADRWELLRAFAGRRNRQQIRELEWTGDPEPYLSLIPAYGEREDALAEG